MKGVIKCFIFSGILMAVSLVSCLGFGSHNVSALKYAYSAFPLYNYAFVRVNTGSVIRTFNGFSITFDDSENNIDSSFDTSLVLGNYDVCSTTNTRSTIWDSTRDLNAHTYNLHTRLYFSKLVNSSEPITCFGLSNGSLPVVRYSYDSLYAVSYNLSDGSPIKFVDIRNAFLKVGSDSYDEGSLLRLSTPLSLDPDRFSFISSGTTMEWDFGLVQKSANNFPYLSDDISAVMDVSYFTLSPDSPNSYSDFYNSYKSSTAVDHPVARPTCTVDYNYLVTTKTYDLWEDYLGFNVHCTYTAPSDLYYFNPRISLSADGPILDYNYSGLYFSGSYFVTDNDDTWSGEYANSDPSGDDLDNAPGYHQLYGYDEQGCSEGDWLCGLTNLFGFSFINPFAPLFSMFTDQSSCASIPIISSMLNSNETTYCPWFDSSVRSILTPVLSISAMMLIFGFLVRWLSSSSGNMFEDQTTHKWGNTQFKQGGN